MFLIFWVSRESIKFEGIDVADGAPVIAVKIYEEDFDVWSLDRFGWFGGRPENADHHLFDKAYEVENSRV